MNEQNDRPDAKQPGFFKRLWQTVSRPSSVYSLGSLLVVGGVGGVLFWGAFNWGLEVTNTEKFCIGCHEMYENVYLEYKDTIHYNNHSGVRATCPDCHVPKEWVFKVRRKIVASAELYHHFRGTVSTPEKFEQERQRLAMRVWRAMKNTDSRECRNCHNFEYMDFTFQEERSGVAHQQAIDENKTCIDCHQGVAHRLPADAEAAYERVAAEFDEPGKDANAAAGAPTEPSAADRLAGFVAGLKQ